MQSITAHIRECWMVQLSN